MEGYWMDVNSGMLLSSLMNTGKECSPSTFASEDAVVFRLFLTTRGATN